MENRRYVQGYRWMVLLAAFGMFVPSVEARTAKLEHAAGTAEVSRPAIIDMEAFLFFGESGKIDTTNVAFREQPKGGTPPILVNAPLGENSEDGPSNALLVIVSVNGSNREIIEQNYAMTFRAIVERKEIARFHVEGRSVAPFNEGVIRKVPFVVHGTGCKPVSLVAEIGITGRTPVHRAERVVPFRCYD